MCFNISTCTEQLHICIIRGPGKEEKGKPILNVLSIPHKSRGILVPVCIEKKIRIATESDHNQTIFSLALSLPYIRALKEGQRRHKGTQTPIMCIELFLESALHLQTSAAHSGTINSGFCLRVVKGYFWPLRKPATGTS